MSLALGILAATVVAVVVSATAFKPPGNPGAFAPTCGTGHSIILAAQAVPSAALVPCAARCQPGWSVHDGADIASGHATFWLDSDVAGARRSTITLSATCDLSGARQVPSDQPGTRRFDRLLSQPSQVEEQRFYTFPGGCVSYQFKFSGGGSSLLGDSGERRGRASCPGPLWWTTSGHRGPGVVRAGCGMSGLSRLVAARAAGGAAPGRPGTGHRGNRGGAGANRGGVRGWPPTTACWPTSSGSTTRGCGSWSPAGRRR